MVTKTYVAAPLNYGRFISVTKNINLQLFVYTLKIYNEGNVIRDRIVASSVLERERASSEAQTLGRVARGRDVHLRRYDGSAREKRLLAMGREHCLLVPVEE